MFPENISAFRRFQSKGMRAAERYFVYTNIPQECVDRVAGAATGAWHAKKAQVNAKFRDSVFVCRPFSAQIDAPSSYILIAFRTDKHSLFFSYRLLLFHFET